MSAWRIQSSGVAIERYAWMRANVSGCEIDSGPCGGESGSGSSPLQIRRALPASIARSWASSRPAILAVRRASSSEPGCWP